MANEADAKSNALLWMLMQIHMDKAKSNLIKGAHSVSDSNLDCEKVCIDCTNGDVIELVVNNAEESVYATLTLKQDKANPDKIIKGKMIYSIHKWSNDFEVSQLSAYIAKLMYVIKDVQAMYENGTFVALCMCSSGSTDKPNLDWCKDATFQTV